MIKALIIDDEERGIDALSQLLTNYCPDVSILGVAQDISTAATMIEKLKPEVIFLDVEMPGGNGFQLIEQLDKIDFDIIFVTAYNDYAIRALRFSALDYLLKPVRTDELQSAVQKVKDKQNRNTDHQRLNNLKSSLSQGNPFNKIILNTMNGYSFVKISDIIYCEADENYTHFYLTDQTKITASKPLKEYEELFEKYNFFRIHKSFLINLSHIDFVNKDSWVVMSNRKEVPVSFRRRGDFFSLLKEIDNR